MGNEISHAVATEVLKIRSKKSQISFPKISFKKKKKRKILILSLDAAGKTSILYKLKLGKLVNTIPTIGYNHEEIEYRNAIFDLWDIGGQEKVRTLWSNYFINIQGIIFVVDSSDRERLEEAHQVLKYVEELINEFHCRKVVLLIFANKQDLPNSMTIDEIHNGLKLTHLYGITYQIFTCCIKNDQDAGLYEGLNWLYKELKIRY